MSIHDELDIFRHTPLRYLGYANEVGEAFRYQISKKVLALAYVVSFGYIIGDTIDKGYKSYKQKIKEYNFKNNKLVENENQENLKNKKSSSNDFFNIIIKNASLSFSWQVLATEFLPAGCVFIIVKFAKKFKFSLIKSKKIKYWMPSIIGLLLIPTFPYTIDPTVDKLFDQFNLNLDLH